MSIEPIEFGSLISQGRGEPLPRKKSPRDKALRGVKVLVADDDDEGREMLAEVLTEENGWHVLQASNGTQAYDLAIRERPHALVLDQRMPGLVGTDVVLKLREAGHSIPVVIVTAVRDARELVESVGIEVCLVKPYGYDQLIDAVRRVTRLPG